MTKTEPTRYTLLRCNDMGEDSMSRCYMVAKPEDGGEELMAGKHKWIRAEDYDTLAQALAGYEAELRSSNSVCARRETDKSQPARDASVHLEQPDASR